LKFPNKRICAGGWGAKSFFKENFFVSSIDSIPLFMSPIPSFLAHIPKGKLTHPIHQHKTGGQENDRNQ